MSEKNLSDMFSLNAIKWTPQNERTATAQTYTRFGAVHCVIFVNSLSYRCMLKKFIINKWNEKTLNDLQEKNTQDLTH